MVVDSYDRAKLAMLQRALERERQRRVRKAQRKLCQKAVPWEFVIPYRPERVVAEEPVGQPPEWQDLLKLMLVPLVTVLTLFLLVWLGSTKSPQPTPEASSQQQPSH
jgi:hypothetical protein